MRETDRAKSVNVSIFDAAGEHYSTTYEAGGAVTLAVMSANEFHAYTDRAIVNKSNTIGGASDLSVA